MDQNIHDQEQDQYIFMDELELLFNVYGQDQFYTYGHVQNIYNYDQNIYDYLSLQRAIYYKNNYFVI